MGNKSGGKKSAKGLREGGPPSTAGKDKERRDRLTALAMGGWVGLGITFVEYSTLEPVASGME